MGMTIEKAIDRLEDLHFEQDNWEDGELTEDCLLNKEALRQAIDIIHKYQQIVQIYQKWMMLMIFHTIKLCRRLERY